MGGWGSSCDQSPRQNPALPAGAFRPEIRSSPNLSPGIWLGGPDCKLRFYNSIEGQCHSLYLASIQLNTPCRCLRCIRTKPPATRPKFLLYAQYQFQHPSKGGSVSKRDFGTIEYLLRQGKKTLEMWETGGVNDCWVTKDMQEWGKTVKKGRR